MIKKLAFELILDEEYCLIQGVFKEDKLYFCNLLNTREFTDIEDYTIDLIEADAPPLQALIKSIKLDETLEDRIRNANGDKLKVIYRPEDLPIEPLKKEV
ncbi:hypothetical protein [Cetobacterium sp.]|uniref:hypothetical protein n=1 Tax=Cetobacterium sp. TaxID=2071632 RepID=UPI003F3FE773